MSNLPIFLSTCSNWAAYVGLSMSTNVVIGASGPDHDDDVDDER